MTDPKKVAICTPCRDDVKTDFAMSLTFLCTELMRQGYSLTIYDQHKTILAEARTSLTDEALKDGAEWLLFLDSDMVFPPDAAIRMLAHDKDIVTTGACTRGIEAVFTARRFRGERIEDGFERLIYDPNKTGIEPIGFTGLAVTLIRASVFERIERPWYFNNYSPELREIQADNGEFSSGFIGEDVWFFYQAKRAGIEAWLDWGVTHQVGHIGSFTYHPGKRYLPRGHYLQPGATHE